MIKLRGYRYIPEGALKVTDKHSDGVAYLYTSAKGRPGAIGYYGKATKPAFHFTFASEARRETYLHDYFAGRRATAARKAEDMARRSQPHKLDVGHVLVASWGYEQTNVDWFQVTRVVSSTMVEVRPIAATSEDTAWLQGRCMPSPDQFTGPATRHRVTYGDSVRISECVRAHVWDGRPRHWSAYH